MEHTITSVCVFAIFAVLEASATQVDSNNVPQRILHTFNGALTEIKCSSPNPCFHINDTYGPFQYKNFPSLFGIELEESEEHAQYSVILRINGTSLVDNLKVECKNITNTRFSTNTLFQLTLQLQEDIPAPKDLNYNERNGIISWSPPRPDFTQSEFNSSIDLQVTHYNVYITDPQTQTMINFTTFATDFEIADKVIPCEATVYVYAVNSAGEGLRSTPITLNTCIPNVGAEDSTAATTTAHPEHKQEVDKSPLSGGEIAALVITVSFVVLLLVSLSLIVVYCVVVGKHKALGRCEKRPRETRPPLQGETLSTSNPSIRTQQPDSMFATTHTMTLYGLPDVVETDGAKCGNEYVYVNQPCSSAKPPSGLIYAELAATSPNIISQPSCVESTTYAVIDHSININSS